ncbi:hypothetical protein Golob_011189 [Gossypium lobatum]|uniref:Heme oxygenase 2 n=1 Tax=Gossypium lobatum TaxID=34289 RepID=A0A7J8MP32_9ROSI|nr:hypothetical protein [Gossypium lobatum]
MDAAFNSPRFHPTASFSRSQVSFPFFSFQTQYLTLNKPPTILRCSNSSTISSTTNGNNNNMAGLPVKKKRKRYRKQYPGENEGITEEMRFVAMRLRNIKGKKVSSDSVSDSETDTENTPSDQEKEEDSETVKSGENGGDGEAETWSPTMEGFLKYLVDSKFVFNTIERIVDESDDVAYAYFRKTGLERSAGLSKDLEWFSQRDLVVPEPSNPGVSYVNYLEELAEKSAPLFLSHFYNIYFSHIAGGQVIARKVSDQLLEGTELEFYKWEGDVQESLKDVRENLNMLGEHWSRDDRNKCLKEAAKSFKFLGQINRDEDDEVFQKNEVDAGRFRLIMMEKKRVPLTSGSQLIQKKEKCAEAGAGAGDGEVKEAAQMAKTNLIVPAAILAVLLFANGITFSEEVRVLKADHKTHHHSSLNVNVKGDVLPDGSATVNNVQKAAYRTDAFRSTTPGHSPGAGH